MSHLYTILIVSLLPQRRQDLQALLHCLIEEANFLISDYEEAWSVVLQHEPAVVIVDNWFSGEGVTDLLNKIKDAYPLIRCIVLGDAFQEGRLSILGQADVVLESDTPTSRVAEVTRQQLEEREFLEDGTGKDAGTG